MCFITTTSSILLTFLASPEAEARDWFLNWVDNETPPCIEARFVSTVRRRNRPSSTLVKGVWRARIDPYSSYTLEVNHLSGIEVTSVRWLSWDAEAGEGRSYGRSAGSRTLPSPGRPRS